MKLYIAEKPSLGREIAAILGVTKKENAYIECGKDVVTWCFGHMFELFNPQDYGDQYKKWSLDSLPILPEAYRRKPVPKTKTQIAAIRKLLKEADMVINAGDPDREGQLLVDEVIEELNWSGPTERVWISALNAKALKQALDVPKPNTEYKGLRDSAYSRSIADWVVGMNLTRAFTLLAKAAGHDSVFSVGRVQTPTLSLVVNRDEIIANFKPVDYHVLTATFRSAAENYNAAWQVPENIADPDRRCPDKAVAEETARKIEGQQGIIQKAEKTRKKKDVELPFSLSALQTYCSKRWGMSAKQVLEIAQALYEKYKATTYPRTDCRYLASGALAEVSDTINSVVAADNSLEKFVQACDMHQIPKCFNEKKITAHTAIIPTTEAPNISGMNDAELKVYDAIRRRYIAQFMAAYEYDSTTIITECCGELFKVTGSSPVILGWKEILFADDGKDKEDTAELPAVTEGDQVNCKEANVATKQTKPPAPYTEGTLIADMENIAKYVENKEAKKILKSETVKGIGTEATRAAIIDGLKLRGYLLESGKNIVSSDKAKEALKVLPESISDPVTTAEWESCLTDIAANKGNPEKFQADIAAWIKNEVEQVKNGSGQKFEEKQGFSCPNCSQLLRQRKGKNGLFWGCSGYPDCKTTFPDKGGKPDLTPKEKKGGVLSKFNCQACGKPLIRREAKKKGKGGKKNYWWGCSGFPDCRETYFDNNGQPKFKEKVKENESA
ncbi:DNA topoisomerase III [Desulfobacter sp.]|uniref:DNA topoisomerase III n=1 Tax=Desulfobacter sp. TaxID=2294 RepID=UPI003D0DC465